MLATLRRLESAQVIAALKTGVWSQAVLKTLLIGQASAYVVAIWDRLMRFLHDARIPLDNNATERAIRGPVALAASRGEVLLPGDVASGCAHTRGTAHERGLWRPVRLRLEIGPMTEAKLREKPALGEVLRDWSKYDLDDSIYVPAGETT